MAPIATHVAAAVAPLASTSTWDHHQDTQNRYDKGFGLEQAIRDVEHGGFDVMLLMEKKIQTEAYSQNWMGDNLICSTARPSRYGGAQGGVGFGDA